MGEAFASESHWLRTWASSQDQRGYFVVGSWNDWKPVPMYKCIGGVYKSVVDLPGTVEFQVIVDKDYSKAFYPVQPHADSGTSYVKGPDDKGNGMNWLVYAAAGSAVEITLDPQAKDGRQKGNGKQLALPARLCQIMLLSNLSDLFVCNLVWKNCGWFCKW